MAEDIKVNNLIINQLSNEKFATIEKDPTQLYLTPDTSIDESEKGVAGGVATLDSNAKIPTDQIPSLPYLPTSGGTVNGSISVSGSITLSGTSPVLYTSGFRVIGYSQTDRLFLGKESTGLFVSANGDLISRISGEDANVLTSRNKAVPNGVASLGSDGKVPAEQLPEISGGTKRSIGEVYFSQSSLATDNSGALPLFTGETIASANTIYPDFYNWVLAHTELQCTSEEYESSLSTYGECPKYVIVEGSIRLPKLSNYIKAANTSEGVKNIAAGLPNITGYASPRKDGFSGAGLADGAFWLTSDTASAGHVANEGGPGTRINFDASRSNPIYGNSDTVTPSSTTLYQWVVAYTAAIPASEAQAAEFQQGLSGKADTNLGNVASNIDYVVESYSDGEGNWYRVYKSGWLEQGGFSSYSSSWKSVNLLKPFSNKLYTITIATIKSSTGGTGSYQGYSITEITESTFKIHSSDSTAISGMSWYACGQGAE